MNVISWNARGLNNQAKHRLLKRKFQQEKPDIMFIQETKCATNQIEIISKRLGKPIKYIEVASHGWEGGIATFWDTRAINIISMEAACSFIATEV